MSTAEAPIPVTSETDGNSRGVAGNGKTFVPFWEVRNLLVTFR